MRVIINFFHHLFNPHCPDCLAEEEDRFRKEHECTNCENYLMIIEKQRNDYQELLKMYTNRDKPPEIETRPEHEFQPVTRRVPWPIQRARLESKDREEAIKLRKEAEEKIKPVPVVKVEEVKKALTVDELEQALGVENPPTESKVS